MVPTMAFWIYLTLAASAIFIGVAGEFRMEISPHIVQQGQRVKLKCHVIDEDDRVSFEWYRMNIPDDRHEVLAVNEAMTNDYVENRDPGPYQMDGLTSEGNDAVYVITITEAQLEDNAKFGCGRTEERENHVPLTVTKLPDAIYWYSQRTPMTRENAAGMAPYAPNELIQTSESSHGYFMCLADDFIPGPNITITFDGMKLKNFQTTNSVSTVTSPTHSAYTYQLHHTASSASSQLAMTQEANRLPLTCTASVFGETVQATVRPVLEAPPTLTCEDANVPTGMRLAKLTCLVEADPEVDLLKWTWNDAAGDTVDIIAGETLDGNYSSTRDVREDGRIETSLVFEKVYPEMFMKYSLYARNSIDDEYGTATLSRDEDAERYINGGSTAHPAAGLVSLVAWALWRLI